MEKTKLNYKINRISCASCGATKDLIVLPATSNRKMFGLLYSCPECFASLRRSVISIYLNDKKNNKKTEVRKKDNE